MNKVQREYIRTMVFKGEQITPYEFKVHGKLFKGTFTEALIKYTKSEEGGKWITWLKNNYSYRDRNSIINNIIKNKKRGRK